MLSSVESSNDNKSEVVLFAFPGFGRRACGVACGGACGEAVCGGACDRLSILSKSLLRVSLMDVKVDSVFCCPASSFRMESCWRVELLLMIEISLEVSSSFFLVFPLIPPDQRQLPLR